MFDVYYQIAIEIAGRDAETFLQGLIVADAAGLARAPRVVHIAVQRGRRNDRRPDLLSPLRRTLLVVSDARRGSRLSSPR